MIPVEYRIVCCWTLNHSFVRSIWKDQGCSVFKLIWIIHALTQSTLFCCCPCFLWVENNSSVWSVLMALPGPHRLHQQQWQYAKGDSWLQNVDSKRCSDLVILFWCGSDDDAPKACAVTSSQSNCDKEKKASDQDYQKQSRSGGAILPASFCIHSPYTK